MTARQKFWLKVALAVTFPLWVVPFIAGLIAVAIVVTICGVAWEAADSIVDPKPRRMGGKRMP